MGYCIKRNRDIIDREISESQSGFRSGIGTREGIFNIRAITEKMLAVKKKMYRVSQKKECLSFLCIYLVIIAFTYEINMNEVTYFV